MAAQAALVGALSVGDEKGKSTSGCLVRRGKKGGGCSRAVHGPEACLLRMVPRGVTMCATGRRTGKHGVWQSSEDGGC
jgi:hypothetical protein